jgi:hypothetical protein
MTRDREEPIPVHHDPPEPLNNRAPLPEPARRKRPCGCGKTPRVPTPPPTEEQE